jgi:hypothetical protein
MPELATTRIEVVLWIIAALLMLLVILTWMNLEKNGR